MQSSYNLLALLRQRLILLSLHLWFLTNALFISIFRYCQWCQKWVCVKYSGFGEPVTYQKKICVLWVQTRGYLALRILHADTLTRLSSESAHKTQPFFLINYASPKTYQFLFFFCCRAVMRMTRLCGRTLLIKASTFILFFGTITIFRFSILRIA